MYEIQAHVGNQWSVVDDRGQILCVGPLYQCEAWLDARDNDLVAESRSPSPRTHSPNVLPWAGMLGQKVYALLRHPFTTGGAIAREAAQPTE